MVKKWKDLVKETVSPDRMEKLKGEVRRELLVMELRELRKSKGMTQVEIAALMDIGQHHVSGIENRTDHHVSTLRKLIEAMGGKLIVSAQFDDEIIQLKDV